MNVPKTKAEELQERVADLCESPSPDPFTLRRLKAEAEKLKPKDPPMAFYLMGLLASVEYNPDGVRENFNKALQFPLSSEGEFVCRGNYITALGRMGHGQEALEFCRQSLDKFPTQKDFIKQFIAIHMQLGRLQTAAKRAKEEKLEYASLILCAEFLAQEGVTDEETQQMVAPELAILREKRIFIHEQTVGLFSDEDSTWVSYDIRVKKSIKEVVDMEVELAEAVAKLDIPPRVLSLFNVSFSVWEE
ncbi:MAG: hypothetical protein OEV94_04930 [Deltaproteobacteria bacterium]|nr:hypothetical protein [Deltaproteobacteria bacterium]